MKTVSKVLALFLFLLLFFASAVHSTTLRDKVENKVKETIISTLSLPEEKVKISFRNLDQLDYAEKSKVKVFILSKREPRGVVPIRVEIYSQDKLLKSKVFTVEVKIYEDVVVCAKKLNRHEEITPDKLKVENRDVTNFFDSYFKSKEDIENRRATKTMPKGRILSKSSLEDIPLVNRGDKVRIIAQIGGVKVWAFGTAHQDGRLGERIKIKNTDSKKIITAEVIDKQTVCVTLDKNL